MRFLRLGAASSVLVLLVLFVAPWLVPHRPRYSSHARAELDEMNKVLVNTLLDYGRYPSNGVEAAAFLRDGLQEGFLWGNSNALPRDPWDVSYVYKRTGSHYFLYSMGPDRKPNTPDDIQSAQ